MSRLGQWGREGLPPHSAFCSMQAFSDGRRSAPLGSLRLKCSSRSETHPPDTPGKMSGPRARHPVAQSS